MIRPRISLIAACANNGVIGYKNNLPWHLSADLKRFKELTLNKTVIMGRKTYDSIGKPLPNRENIIVTRDHSFQANGCIIAHSLQEAITQAHHDEIMIIGGATIYQQAFSIADRLYLTRIHLNPEGDAFFPEWDIADWQLVSTEKHPLDPETNPIAFTFEIYVRKESLSNSF